MTQDGKARRYHVSGIDDIGDVHSFGTDHRDRADEMVTLMREDLDQVEMREVGSAD